MGSGVAISRATVCGLCVELFVVDVGPVPWLPHLEQKFRNFTLSRSLLSDSLKQPPRDFESSVGRGSAESIGQRAEHGVGAGLPGVVLVRVGGARVGGGARLRGGQRLPRRPRLVCGIYFDM